MASISTFESLGIRDYRLLWLGQVSTSMGQWMDQTTRGWLIYQLTGSGLHLGFAMASRGLPLLLFGIIAGAFADRSGRRLQLVTAQVVNAVLNAILALLVITGLVEEWHVYVTAFLAGTVQAFQQPARQTLISDLVPENRLLNALALNSAALNASRMVGPALAGVLITMTGVGGSYMTQAVMYLVATVWTLQIHFPANLAPTRADGSRERLPFMQSIGEGLAFAGHEPNVRAQLLLGLGPLTFAMSYMALMPLIAIEVLGGDAILQGALLSVIGAGALAGALTVASMRRDHAYGLSVVVAAVAFCGSVFAFGSSHWVWVSLVLGFFLGLMSVTYTTQNQTLLQVLTPRELRGRVMSIYLLDRGLVPLGAIVAGTLASSFGGQDAVRALALIALAIVAVVVATHPRILRLEVPLAGRLDRGGRRGGTGRPSQHGAEPPAADATGTERPARAERGA
ncbi:MAG: MFS transporter [Dehalococcoidia bacterium]